MREPGRHALERREFALCSPFRAPENFLAQVLVLVVVAFNCSHVVSKPPGEGPEFFEQGPPDLDQLAALPFQDFAVAFLF